MTTLVEQAPAKINLTLRIVGRRADGYHELESLVVFASIGDTLTLTPGQPVGLDIGGPNAAVCGPADDNLVLEAVKALSERIPGLKGGHFHLEKHLPVAAGIGGGSSDAAAALRLLARANALRVDDPRLVAAALSVGADVPVCLDPRPRVMRGIGDILSSALALPEIHAVLVNPNVPLATRDVFAKLDLARTGKTPLGDVPTGVGGLFDFLGVHGNDLTDAAVACAPVVGAVLATLEKLSGARLTRMSGSGSTCFALFETAEAAGEAAQVLRMQRADWWVAAAVLG